MATKWRVGNIGLNGKQISAAHLVFYCPRTPQRWSHFIAAKVTQFLKRCKGGLTTLPAPGAEKNRMSAYPAHMVIEAIVQDKHSSNYSYSSPVES